MHARVLSTCSALLAVLVLAACGGSKAPGIAAAPSGGAAQAPVPTTPKVPAALSSKPLVTVPKSCSNKQLITKDLIPGTGAQVQVGQTVTVNYVGVLCKGGAEFDSSWKTGKLATFPLTPGSLIPGWIQGIPGMKVGGRRELIVPAALAYGKAGRPPTIPPNSPLVFVVDVISVA